MIFTKWAGAMPYTETKTCASMGVDVGHGYEWEDKDCTEHAAFICVQRKSQPLSVFSVSVHLHLSSV